MPSTHRLTPELQAEVDGVIEAERVRKLLPLDKGPSQMATVTNHAKGPRFLPITVEGGAPQYSVLAPGESATLRLDASVMNTPVFKAMVAIGEISVEDVDADEDTEHNATYAGRLGHMNHTLPAGEMAQVKPGNYAETEANVHMPLLPLKARKPQPYPVADDESEAEADTLAPDTKKSTHKYK